MVEEVTKVSSEDHLLAGAYRVAREDPSRAALVEGELTVTYRDLIESVEATARTLAGFGVTSGSVVGVQLPNSVHLATVAMAVWRLGATYHPLNVAYRAHDLIPVLRQSRPALYIHPVEHSGFSYTRLASELSQQLEHPFLDVPIDLGEPLAASIAVAESAASLPDLSELPQDGNFLLGATSGSTGPPKLYIHRHDTQLSEARVVNQELGLDHTDITLAVAPMTHRGALMFGLITNLVACGTLVIERNYSPAAMLESIYGHSVTAFMAIPTQVVDLLGLAREEQHPDCAMRRVLIAGAAVHKELVRELRQTWPECVPITAYGTSETGYAVMTRPNDPPDKLETCGRPIPGAEVRIVPGDASSTTPETGQIEVRGKFLFAGYLGATRPSGAQDWFATGDLGHLDADGYLLVTGRLTNTINRGGLKIQAEELEALLTEHPDVDEAAVVPAPDKRLGEIAVAYIVSRGELTLSLADMRKYLEERGVAKFKWPQHLVTLDALPRSGVSKVDRHALKGWASRL